MKVIDAFWEKRNLGVTAVEFKIDASDNVNEIKSVIADANAQYQVVRAPVSRFDIYTMLQQLGFTFIETMYQMVFDFTLYEIIWGKYDEHVSYKEICNEEDLETVYSNIRNGLFKNNRISLDSRFGKEQADKRYIGMINDKLAQGGKVCSIIHRNEDIGFFATREMEDKHYEYFLAGIYSKYQKQGLGSNAYTQMLAYVKNNGARTVTGDVSMNNIGSYKMFNQSGFKLRNAEYVFIKHK